MRALRFANLLGIRTAPPIHPPSSQGTTAKTNIKPKLTTTTRQRDFSHLVAKGSAAYRALPPAATVQAPVRRPMTSAEAARMIVEAGAKARGNGTSRYTNERIADMQARAKIDRYAGAAAQIINAGRKARGEVLEVL